MPQEPCTIPIDWLPEPMLFVSAEGIIERCNHAYAVYFDVEPGSVGGMRLDSIALEPPSTIAAYLSACALSEEPVTDSLTFRCHRGALRCGIYGIAVPAQGVAASPRVLLCVYPRTELTHTSAAADALSTLHAEIARRHFTEDALRREKETLEVTLASIGDGVIVTDAGGRVTFLNGVAEQLTGWSRQEASHRPFENIFRIVNAIRATRSNIR
jgi:PAS domain-containing protein